MRRMLISRISRRVLVEHHVALTQGLCKQSQDDDPDAPKHVGIIYTNLSVKDSINKCIRYLKSEEGMYGLRRLEEPALRGTGIWPEIVVDGHLDARFPYIKEHLEYIIFALLKNVRTVSSVFARLFMLWSVGNLYDCIADEGGPWACTGSNHGDYHGG
jgi:pyruvate dehydrogenase kinase 2/3/4